MFSGVEILIEGNPPIRFAAADFRGSFLANFAKNPLIKKQPKKTQIDPKSPEKSPLCHGFATEAAVVAKNRQKSLRIFLLQCFWVGGEAWQARDSGESGRPVKRGELADRVEKAMTTPYWIDNFSLSCRCFWKGWTVPPVVRNGALFHRPYRAFMNAFLGNKLSSCPETPLLSSKKIVAGQVSGQQIA